MAVPAVPVPRPVLESQEIGHATVLAHFRRSVVQGIVAAVESARRGLLGVLPRADPAAVLSTLDHPRAQMPFLRKEVDPVQLLAVP